MTHDLMSYVAKSWPRAIAHVDGDAFFASVEQAVKPYLKGKPVVTGKERNIVAAASYEAKAFGVKRGVALWEARKMCPGLVVLPTDYETVSIFSKRMYEIMRRYTPAVEEYSIDEGFADLTGLRRLHRTDYRGIAAMIKEDIERELGIGVTVGLSVSKVLAKVASKLGKPGGCLAISNREREAYLSGYALEEVWTIGPNTAALLRGYGIVTAGQFAAMEQERVERILTRPGVAAWRELRGESVWPVSGEVKKGFQSISKMKTFTPSAKDKDYVWAQLVKNMENACIKARRYGQAAKEIVVFLKRHDHRAYGLEAKLLRPSAYPLEMMKAVRDVYERVFVPGTSYRATGFIMRGLVSASLVQASLFEDPIRIVKTRRLYGAVDEAREKYGKHVVHQAASLAGQRTQHLTGRGDVPVRRGNLFKGESRRRRLPLPVIVELI